VRNRGEKRSIEEGEGEDTEREIEEEQEPARYSRFEGMEDGWRRETGKGLLVACVADELCQSSETDFWQYQRALDQGQQDSMMSSMLAVNEVESRIQEMLDEPGKYHKKYYFDTQKMSPQFLRLQSTVSQYTVSKHPLN